MAEKLERSILLVPASNWNMIQKTATSNADAVCIDLEDAVTVDEKRRVGRTWFARTRNWISATS